jgi:hypothetical protein
MHNFNYLLLVCAACSELEACSIFKTEVPGIFYDVHLSAPPASSLCVEFSRAIVARTNLILAGSYIPPQTPTQCFADLTNGGTDSIQVKVHTDPKARLLLVGLREFGFFLRPEPSAAAKQLGAERADVIHEKFPNAEVTAGKRYKGLLAP